MFVHAQEVDVILMRTFSDLSDADVSEDPLIQLPGCGHVFTRDTLDGHMELHRYYEKVCGTVTALRDTRSRMMPIESALLAHEPCRWPAGHADTGCHVRPLCVRARVCM